MPTTRKKVIKTVYEDENDSEAEKAAGDFSDSGSDAKVSDYTMNEDEEESSDNSSGHELNDKFNDKHTTPLANSKSTKLIVFKNRQLATEYINRIKQQAGKDRREVIPLHKKPTPRLSVRLLPSFVNVSDSESSDDESPRISKQRKSTPIRCRPN